MTHATVARELQSRDSDSRMLALIPGLADALGASVWEVSHNRRAAEPFFVVTLHDEHTNYYGLDGSLVNAWTEAERKFRAGQARYAAESMRIAETEGAELETGT